MSGSGNSSPAKLTDRSIVPLDEDESRIEGNIIIPESMDDPGFDSEDFREGLELESLKQDIEHRKLYSGRIFMFVSVWVLLVMFAVFAQGWSFGQFQLSDKVLMTLIGGTTVNVLGLFAIVANYLFPKK